MKPLTIDEAQKEFTTFLDNKQTMILSTVSKEGEPFASYSPFTKDEEGNFYLFLSTAVPHSHNMYATGKAHMMFIEDEAQAKHIFARNRLYYKAKVEKFEENDSRSDSIHELFKDKFGGAVAFFAQMKDFRIYKLIPSDGNLVLGFGAAYKISEDGVKLTLNVGGHSQKHEEGLKNNVSAH